MIPNPRLFMQVRGEMYDARAPYIRLPLPVSLRGNAVPTQKQREGSFYGATTKAASRKTDLLRPIFAGSHLHYTPPDIGALLSSILAFSISLQPSLLSLLLSFKAM